MKDLAKGIPHRVFFSAPGFRFQSQLPEGERAKPRGKRGRLPGIHSRRSRVASDSQGTNFESETPEEESGPDEHILDRNWDHEYENCVFWGEVWNQIHDPQME